MAYTFVATDFRRLPRALKRMLYEFRDDTREAANEALEVAHKEAVDLTEAGEHVVKGDYMAGFKVLYDRSETTGGGTLVNSSNHAEVIEYGAQTHLPPFQRIYEWVLDKFGLDEARSRVIAATIRENILAEGLPTESSPYAPDPGQPFRIMGRAAEAAQDYLEQEFADIGSASKAMRRLIRYSRR
jgi:hypothetical protein